MSATASLSRTDRNLHQSDWEFQTGRDEINLAEFPLWYHGKQPPKSNTLVYTSTINDSKAGRIINRKMTVRGVDDYGLPSSRDGDVLIALFKLAWQDNQFESRSFQFTFKDLMNELGWDDSGSNYDRIEMAIKRWDSVHITYDGWYDKGIGTWAEAPMLCGILGGGKLQPKNKRHLKSMMRWHEDFYETLSNKNILRIDHDAYKKLTTPSAKQALRFISKELGITPVIKIELRQLACEHFGLSRSYKPNRLRKECDKIFDQLEAIGKIAPAPLEGRYVREDRSTWTVTIKKPRNSPLPPDLRQTELFVEEGLVGQLTERGVKADIASDLAAKYASEIVERQIEIFDWVLKHGSKKIETPGPYLADRIRKNYDPPEDFQTKAEQAAIQEAAAKQELQKRKAAAAEKKHEAEATKVSDAKHAAELQQMIAYLDALPPAERQVCVDTAISTLIVSWRAQARKDFKAKDFSKPRVEMALRNHVLPLVQKSEAV